MSKVASNKKMKYNISIEARIFLKVNDNPVRKYLDQSFETPEGFGWRGCTHSPMGFHRSWAGERIKEIDEKFIIEEAVTYDLFCVTAGANSGFTQYVLAIKDRYNIVHVATGNKLMHMYWVRKEDVEQILNYIKGFEVTTLGLVKEGANSSEGESHARRYGWVSTDPDTDWDEAQSLVTLNGFPTGLIRLPNYGATDDSVIFIRQDKPEHPGWDQLLEALGNMKDGEIIQHYAFVPYSGTLVNVKRVGDGYRSWPEHMKEAEAVAELQLSDIIGSVASGYAVNEKIFPFVREYFIENSKGWIESAYCKDDIYFMLLNKAGISLAIEVARENGHTGMEKKLQSWVDAGMSDQEGRYVWLDGEKDSCYNHTYYWRGKEVAYESYGLESPRHKTICYAKDSINL